VNLDTRYTSTWYDPDSQTGRVARLHNHHGGPSFSYEASADALSCSVRGYDVDLEWNGPPTISGSLLALQYVTDPASRLPVAFWYDHAGAAADATQPHYLGPQLNLRPVNTDTVQGAVTIPPGYSLGDKFVAAEFPEGNHMFLYKDGFSGGSDFSYMVPDLVNATTQVCAIAKDNVFKKSMSVACDVASNNDGVLSIPITAAPEPFAPDHHGTGVCYTTLFQWTPYANGIYVVTVKPKVSRMNGAVSTYTDSDHPPKFVIVTDSPRTTIPDLSAIGAALLPDTTYEWVVRGMGPYASTDEFVSYDGSPLPPVPAMNMVPSRYRGNMAVPVGPVFWGKSRPYTFDTCNSLPDCQ
jgi:hypothetical protein